MLTTTKFLLRLFNNASSRSKITTNEINLRWSSSGRNDLAFHGIIIQHPVMISLHSSFRVILFQKYNFRRPHRPLGGHFDPPQRPDVPEKFAQIFLRYRRIQIWNNDFCTSKWGYVGHDLARGQIGGFLLTPEVVFTNSLAQGLFFAGFTARVVVVVDGPIIFSPDWRSRPWALLENQENLNWSVLCIYF